MGKWQVFQKLRAALKNPDALGDVAVYKGELAGSKAKPHIEAALAAMEQPLPTVDVPALTALPRGTLGREYVQFLAANELQPFRLSPDIDDRLVRRNLFIARYGLVHDVFHVLTGFGTDLPGELGVWSFVAAQGYARGHWVAVISACLIYPFLAPLSLGRLWRNLRRGIKMGRRARSLISVPFDQRWHSQVSALRDELAIDAADELAV